MIQDPYSYLGVSRDASEDEIKSAYRKKSKECHPDLHPDDPHAEEKFKEVNEAYDMIKNPEKYAQMRAQSSYGYNPYGQTNPYQNNPYENPYQNTYARGTYENPYGREQHGHFGFTPFGFYYYSGGSQQGSQNYNQSSHRRGRSPLGTIARIFITITIFRFMMGFLFSCMSMGYYR